MNWAGKLCQKEIGKKDSVLDLGCGIMQATMDFNGSKGRLRCGSLVGVDACGKYLDVLRSNRVECLEHDLTCFPYPFNFKSFDVVLALDVLEHLSVDDAVMFLYEACRIARRKVLVLTPSVFNSNVEHVYNSWGLGINSLQRHKCLISRDWLLNHGFKVKIVTDNSLWGVLKL